MTNVSNSAQKCKNITVIGLFQLEQTFISDLYQAISEATDIDGLWPIVDGFRFLDIDREAYFEITLDELFTFLFRENIVDSTEHFDYHIENCGDLELLAHIEQMYIEFQAAQYHKTKMEAASPQPIPFPIHPPLAHQYDPVNPQTQVTVIDYDPMEEKAILGRLDGHQRPVKELSVHDYLAA